MLPGCKGACIAVFIEAFLGKSPSADKPFLCPTGTGRANMPIDRQRPDQATDLCQPSRAIAVKSSKGRARAKA